MKIGDVFTFGGDEYAIKKIDKNYYDKKKYPNGRVDASKFIGEGAERRIQRGKPKAFDLNEIATLLTGDLADFGYNDSSSDSEAGEMEDLNEEVIDEWNGLRGASPDGIKEVLNMLPEDKDSLDW